MRDQLRRILVAWERGLLTMEEAIDEIVRRFSPALVADTDVERRERGEGSQS